jgi:hypothetical protein
MYDHIELILVVLLLKNCHEPMWMVVKELMTLLNSSKLLGRITKTTKNLQFFFNKSINSTNDMGMLTFTK